MSIKLLDCSEHKISQSKVERRGTIWTWRPAGRPVELGFYVRLIGEFGQCFFLNHCFGIGWENLSLHNGEHKRYFFWCEVDSGGSWSSEWLNLAATLAFTGRNFVHNFERTFCVSWETCLPSNKLLILSSWRHHEMEIHPICTSFFN